MNTTKFYKEKKKKREREREREKQHGAISIEENCKISFIVSFFRLLTQSG